MLPALDGAFHAAGTAGQARRAVPKCLHGRDLEPSEKRREPRYAEEAYGFHMGCSLLSPFLISGPIRILDRLDFPFRLPTIAAAG